LHASFGHTRFSRQTSNAGKRLTFVIRVIGYCQQHKPVALLGWPCFPNFGHYFNAHCIKQKALRSVANRASREAENRGEGSPGQRRGMKVLISWLEAQPPTGGN
jgi:hypothetical protein